MKYKMSVFPLETTGGTIWMAEYEGLRCGGEGLTPQDAVADAESNLEVYLIDMKELGEPIPEEYKENNYSGKFVVRISKNLHKKLVEKAQHEGVSVNHFVSEAIASVVYSPSNKDFNAFSKAITDLKDSLSGLDYSITKTTEEYNKRIYESTIKYEKIYSKLNFGGWNKNYVCN